MSVVEEKFKFVVKLPWKGAVPSIHLVKGGSRARAHDIIARVESDTILNLKNAISNKIRKLEKVRSTLTMIVTNVIV